MPVRSIGELMVTNNFQIARVDYPAVSIAGLEDSGQTIIVATSSGYPIGILDQEILRQITDWSLPLASYKDRFLTPTLTQIDTPLYIILQGFLTVRAISWHIIYQNRQVVGVVPRRILNGEWNSISNRPPEDLPKSLQSIIDGLPLNIPSKLPGDVIQPPPNLCYRCTAETPPHKIKWSEIDNAHTNQPRCRIHDVRVTIENPCQGN